MAVRPPVVRIVRLDYERTVPIETRRPIRVYVHTNVKPEGGVRSAMGTF